MRSQGRSSRMVVVNEPQTPDRVDFSDRLAGAAGETGQRPPGGRVSQVLVVVATVLTVAWLVFWIVGGAQDNEFDALAWVLVGFAAGLVALVLWWAAACIPIVRRIGSRWLPAFAVWTLVALGLALYERGHIEPCGLKQSWDCGDPATAIWLIASVWAFFAIPLACAGLFVGRHTRRREAPKGRSDQPS